MVSHRLLPILALISLAACGGRSVELPAIDGWTGEPQVAAAIESARRAAREDPSASNLGRLGELFHAHDLFPEAVACYRQALELAPGEWRWPYLAALATRKLDIEASLALFALAVQRGADHPAVFIEYGDTLAQLDRWPEAAERYETALSLDPESTHALLGLARADLAAGDLERARERLERARSITPWHGDVHLQLAQVYQRLGRAKEAKEELLVAGAYPEPTRASDPVLQGVLARGVNSAALVERGRRLARAGRFAEAEALYRRVLEIRPGTADDYSNLGGALASQGQTAEAIANYQKALALEPGNPSALNNLAMSLANGGDLEGAVDHLERALASEPAYAEAHRNLGLVRSRQGRERDAIEHYREALRHNPSFAQAHNDLATALAAEGEMDAARDSWRRALAIDPRELSALYNLSVALASDGEHREARQWLERGLEIAPNSSRLAGLMAWELATAPAAELRDGERAAALARRVYEAYPGQPRAGDVLAAALAETGRFEQAVEVAGRALEQAQAARQAVLARQIDVRLALYRRGEPYRQER